MIQLSAIGTSFYNGVNDVVSDAEFLKKVALITCFALGIIIVTSSTHAGSMHFLLNERVVFSIGAASLLMALFAMNFRRNLW